MNSDFYADSSSAREEQKNRTENKCRSKANLTTKSKSQNKLVDDLHG